MTTTTRSPRPVKPVTGWFRWILDNRQQPGRESLVEITVQDCQGVNRPGYYWLKTHQDNGRVTGYRLEKLGTDGQDQHDIDASVPYPACDCKDFEYRRNGRDEKGCKHVVGLRVAGLLPVPRSIGDLAANDPEAYRRMEEDWDDSPASEPMSEAELDAMAASYGQ